MMCFNKKKAQKVSKLKKSKCGKCNTIFPTKKSMHILQEAKTEVCCSPGCLPDGYFEILNCRVCNLIVTKDSIFCSLCICWVHQHCAKLSDDDLLSLNKNGIDWMCFPCKKDIFPCISQKFYTTVKNTIFKPPYWFKNKKCYNCKSKNMQKDCLSAYSNNKVTYFCSLNCSKYYDIEYLDCTKCGNYVKCSKKVSSICCDSCKHWVHKNAVA